MPKLAGVVDSLESVPEAYKAAYEQKDGKFFLKEIEFEDSAPLKEKLAKKEKAINEANQKLGRYTKFQELNDDELDDLLTLRELKKAGKPLTVDEKAELERLNKKALDKVSGELEAERKARQADQAQLKHYKLTVPLRDIAVKAGVIAEDLDLVMLDVQKRFALNDDGKIVVLDADGDATDVTPQKFFETLYKEQRPKFYAASDRGGGGTPPNDRRGGGGTKTIRRSDQEALNSNIEAIAKGEITVVD
jgi:hypothetical protein